MSNQKIVLFTTRMKYGAVAVMLLFFGMWSLLAPATASAQPPSPTLELTKAVSATSIASGTPFEYTFAYRCASITANCQNAVITDVLPPQVTYIPNSATTTPHIQSVAYTPDPSGTTGGALTYTFVNPLPAGSTGILRFQVQFPPGTLPGTVALNRATFSADNAGPVTTPNVSTTATGQFEMTVNKSGGPAVVGYPTPFDLNICSPDTVGGVRFLTPIITDTLPADAIFISAQGAEGVDWVYTPVTAPNLGGTVTFLNLPTIPVGGCFTRQVTLQYDSIPPVQPINRMTVTGAPEGCTNPAALPAHCQGQTTRTLNAQLPINVIAPYPQGEGGKSSSSPSSFTGTEARPGETVTYNVRAVNTGFITLTQVTVTDTIPAEIDLLSFTAGGSATRPVTLTYQINNVDVWLPVAGNPFASNTSVTVASLGLGAGDVVTQLRWQIGEMPVGAPAFSAAVVGTVNSALTPQFPAQSFQNCALVSSPELPASINSCNDVSIVDRRAIPRVTKTGGAGANLPLDFVDYTVTLSNDAVAHLALTSPVLADLIPAQFAYVAGSAVFDSGASAVGAPAPTLEVLPNYNGGRTLLRWTWSGYDLAPGARLVVRYRVQIPDGTAPGTYNNVAALVDWSGPADPDDANRDRRSILLCSGAAVYTDTLDLDGDGNMTEESCQSVAPTNVAVFLAMDSEKFTRGLFDCENTTDYGPTTACEDADYNKLGLTAVGGPVDYRLVLTNASNVSVTNLVVMDIFPRIGDTGVVDTSARGSQWRPNLQGPVTGPAGVPLTIFYSTVANPCRTELVSSGPSGCAPGNWTTTLPADPTSVQAIRLNFCEYNASGVATNCLTIPRNQSFTFDWPMVAPNNAPADASCLTPADDSFNPAAAPACQIAWNSFGYTATEARDVDGQPGNDPGALQLLPSEPNRVGMRVAPPPPFSLGDFVWLDVAGQQNDGVQQNEERTIWGVNGVRVELYDGSGNYLGYRITGPNFAGEPGYYLFPNLAAGSYRVRFYVPDGYLATVPNVGDNTRDSDGEIAGTDPTYGAYYETALIPLNSGTVDANNQDLTWDFGLWLPTDYGDAAAIYPVQASNQITFADAGRHIIVPGIRMGATVDAELDGQPTNTAWGDDLNGSPDDEDGVSFEDYINTAALPTVIMMAGDTSTLTVTASVVNTATQPGYLSAWIDFNADGDWNDSGERILTNQTVNGSRAFNIPIPPTAITGTTYARFRFSTQQNLAPTGTARDGEVEDYRVQIVAQPNKALAATSEAHSTGSNLTIGEIARYRLVVHVPEGELTNFRITDNLPDYLQYLDDGTTRLAFVSTAAMTSTTTALDAAWVAGNETTLATVMPSFTLPTGAISGGPFASGANPIFSLGTLTNPDSDANREFVVVEFNALVLNVTENQDGQTRANTYDVSYGSFLERSNTVNITVREPVLQITKSLVTPLPSPMGPGATVQYDIVITHATTSNLNAFNVVITDLIPVGLINPQVVSVTSAGVTPAVSTGAFTAGELRVPTSGDFDLPRGASVTARISAQIDATVQAAQTITNTANVVWTSLPGAGTPSNPTGSNTPGGSGDSDGERTGAGGVNDYRTSEPEALRIAADWGDLPGVPYPTLAANNGARHLLLASGNPYLGATVDSEFDGQPNATATGDDAAGAPDDEDGVEFRTPLMPGAQAIIRVTTGTPGFLSAFIDFDGDGALDAVPVSAVATVSGGVGTIPGSGFVSDMNFSAAGVYDLTITTPANATGVQAARFRFTQNAGEGGASTTGQAASGEVEDYLLMSLGNQLWYDNGGGNPANAYNGLFDSGEATIPAGVSLTLVVSGTTTPVATTTTDANGRYLFTGLTPGAYQVIVDAANFQSGGLLAGYVSTFTAEANADSNGDNNDNGLDGDATVNGVSSSGVTLSLGQEPTNDGNGVNSNLTVDFGFVRQDWGDLPDGNAANSPSYATLADSNGPRHTVVDGLRLGALIDSELNGQPNATATGDAANLDDEDGVTFAFTAAGLPQFEAGVTTPVTVTVVNTTGVAATVYGFIDWNGDGDFGDAGEAVTSSPVSASGAVVLNFNAPVDANTAQLLGARFRISTATGLTATGVASNGEVEDYLVQAIRLDYGDLPETPYATTRSADGARHVILPTNNPIFGAAVDSEVNGQPNTTATGDDVAGTPDDEDGVSFPAALMANTTATITLTASTGGLPAYYGAFIDLNGDGSFGAGEVFTGTLSNGVNLLSVPVPATVADTIYSRFRIARTPAEVDSATGQAASGEVEDYVLMSLGNQLWYDNGGGNPANAYNGLFDSGEATVPAGVSLTLVVSGTTTPVATTTTDANGRYLFTGLTPGQYQVIVDAANFQSGGLLAGYVSTFTAEANADSNGDNNDNGIDGDATVNGVSSSGVTLSLGQEPTNDGNGANSNLTVDFGFVRQDWGDAPDTFGTTAAANGPRHTIVDGFFLGAGVDSELNGQPTAVANGDDLNGTPDDEDGVVFTTPLVAGRPATITVTASAAGVLNAWIDFNSNGQFDAGEHIASDRPLNAGANALVINVPANATGVMVSRFRLTAAAGQASTPTGVAANGEVEDYILSSLGDFVWHDVNANGVQDDQGEPGVNNVTVRLLDGQGQPVLDGAGNPITTLTVNHPTTGAAGWYEFPGLLPGDYQVEFVAPTGSLFTVADQTANGGAEATDSDADRTTGRTATVTLVAGQVNPDVDAGLVLPVSVGDRVWYDNNGDGLQDDNVEAEAGVQGVVVTLYDTTTQQPVLVAGQPLTATTDADGGYLFDNLPPGDYYVTFDLTTLPAGYVATRQNVGENNAIDSDADRATGRTEATGFLASSQSNLTLDMGIVAPVRVGDTVWYDDNGNGVQDESGRGVSGVRVTLYDATTQQPVLVAGQPLTDVTDADGLYLFENLWPGNYYVVFDLSTLPPTYAPTVQNAGEDDAIDSDADQTTGATAPTGFLPSGNEDLTLDMGILSGVTVGDRVWYDNNGDGLQGDVTAEPGAPNVVVTIYDTERNEPVLIGGQPYTKTTDANGGYLFVNLPPGDYYVIFDLATLPAGYAPTTPNAGDDALDSDADQNGQSGSTGFLPSGQSDRTLDLGIVAPVRVGDRVWIDANGDGLQDANVTTEPGVPGVKVTLYNATTGQPVLVAGQPFTQTTDASGLYHFENLPPGAYYVIFDLTTLPVGYVPTTPNAGDDTLDSDANRTTGQTAATPFLPSNTQNLTLDLGIYAPVTVGDRVWYDNNGDGLQGDVVAEPGVPGVAVTLYNAATGQPVLVAGQPLTDTTDANGLYLFDNLPPGDYYVIFDLTTLPLTYGVTPPNAGDDALDSDANPETGETGSTGFLPSGEEDLALDMGIAAPNLELDKTANSTQIQLGGVVLYTLAYRNSGYGMAQEVVIRETVPNYTTYVAAESSAGWSCADGAGSGAVCTFRVGSVAHGEQGSVIFALRVATAVDPNQVQIRNVANIINGNGEPEDAIENNESEADVIVTLPTALEQVDEPTSDGPAANQVFLYLPAVQR